MSDRYQMPDGTVVDTSNATASWAEATEWDGSNQISKATGCQWNHQRLYRSKRGRFYVERSSQWQGSKSSCEWVSEQAACRWLLANDYSVDGENWPEDLTRFVDDVLE